MNLNNILMLCVVGLILTVSAFAYTYSCNAALDARLIVLEDLRINLEKKEKEYLTEIDKIQKEYLKTIKAVATAGELVDKKWDARTKRLEEYFSRIEELKAINKTSVAYKELRTDVTRLEEDMATVFKGLKGVATFNAELYSELKKLQVQLDKGISIYDEVENDHK